MILKNSMYLLSMGACFLSFVVWPINHSIGDQNSIFSVVSFNVRRDGPEKQSQNKWKARKWNVEELLKTHLQLPSIICFQEPVLSQVQDIASFLKNDSYNWFGKGRGKQWLGMAKNEYLPIFFDTKRFNFIDGGSFVLNKGTQNPFKWKKYGKLLRIATWVHLFDHITKKAIFVYNIHLDHDYDSVRCRSVKVLLSHINAHVKQDQMVFVAGDFNTGFDGKIKQLFHDNGFFHTRTLAQSVNGPVNTAIDWDGKEKYSIDHILVRPGIYSPSVLNYTTVNTVELFWNAHCPLNVLPSDHYPVLATIQID